MKPNEIKAELMLRNVRQVDIAKRLNLKQNTVSEIISGRKKSARVQKEIARIISKPVNEVFPKSA